MSADEPSTSSELSEIPPELENGGPAPSIIPQGIRNKLPPDLVSTMEFGMSVMARDAHPLAKHLTAEHVDKIIDNTESASIREDNQRREKLKDSKHSRLTACVSGFILLIILGVIWGTLPEGRIESFKEIVKDVVLLVAGGAGGYGIAMKKLSEDE